MTDMRTLMRDQCALAIVYAEDGAYSRAGEILTELAKAVNAHAERNIADLAGLTPASAQKLSSAMQDYILNDMKLVQQMQLRIELNTATGNFDVYQGHVCLRAGFIWRKKAEAWIRHQERLTKAETPNVVTPAGAQQIFNAGMDVLNRVTPGPTIKSVRKGWQARPDGSFDHDSKRLKVKGSRRDLLKPWYIMTNSIPGRTDFIQVRRRYYATAEAAMIAAEKIIH